MSDFEELKAQMAELKSQLATQSAQTQIDTAIAIAAPDGLPPIVSRLARLELKDAVAAGGDAVAAVRGLLARDEVKELMHPAPTAEAPKAPAPTPTEPKEKASLSQMLSEIGSGEAKFRSAS